MFPIVNQCNFFYHLLNYLCICKIQHGFARNMDWSVVDSENVEENPVVTLLLKDGPYSRAMWDFGFQALFKVLYHLASGKIFLT